MLLAAAALPGRLPPAPRGLRAAGSRLPSWAAWGSLRPLPCWAAWSWCRCLPPTARADWTVRPARYIAAERGRAGVGRGRAGRPPGPRPGPSGPPRAGAGRGCRRGGAGRGRGSQTALPGPVRDAAGSPAPAAARRAPPALALALALAQQRRPRRGVSASGAGLAGAQPGAGLEPGHGRSPHLLNGAPTRLDRAMAWSPRALPIRQLEKTVEHHQCFSTKCLGPRGCLEILPRVPPGSAQIWRWQGCSHGGPRVLETGARGPRGITQECLFFPS